MSKDLQNLSGRLRFALRQLGVTQTELAQSINVKPQVIQYLCSSESQKSRFTCEIAEALEIDFVWLATGKGKLPKTSNANLENKMSVPIFTFEQLREFKVYKHDKKNYTVSRWIACNEENSYFAVEVNDRSMAPRFDLNTILIIDPMSLSIEKLENGSFYLIYLPDEDFIIFRQLIETNNVRKWVATNKNLYRDILVGERDIILGVCKEARWSI